MAAPHSPGSTTPVTMPFRAKPCEPQPCKSSWLQQLKPLRQQRSEATLRPPSSRATMPSFVARPNVEGIRSPRRSLGSLTASPVAQQRVLEGGVKSPRTSPVMVEGVRSLRLSSGATSPAAGMRSPRLSSGATSPSVEQRFIMDGGRSLRLSVAQPPVEMALQAVRQQQLLQLQQQQVQQQRQQELQQLQWQPPQQLQRQPSQQLQRQLSQQALPAPAVCQQRSRSLSPQQSMSVPPRAWLPEQQQSWTAGWPMPSSHPQELPAAQPAFSEGERMPEISEEQDFPSTGKPMTVRFVCSCSSVPEAIVASSFQGVPITSDWEQWQLLLVSEALLGVHREAQKLYHGGRLLWQSCTLREAMGLFEEQLPERCTVHVVVDRESFPQRLGPFSIVAVPLQKGDLAVPRAAEGGFHWAMKREVLERHGIRMEDAQVTAQCSPTHPVGKEGMGAPATAAKFFWSYPVVRWEQVERDPHVLDDWAEMRAGESALKDFLVVGGFVYLDKEDNVVHATTLQESECGDDSGLQFGRPRKWQAAWTKALLGDGRFQQVTIGPLRKAGVRYFCWLRPGECFLDENHRPLSQQPQVPKGGFAYLFHELAAPSPLDCAVDCYFPVQAMRPHELVKSEPLQLVGQETPAAPRDLVGHISAQLHMHSLQDP